jgi:hypothetical protein
MGRRGRYVQGAVAAVLLNALPAPGQFAYLANRGAEDGVTNGWTVLENGGSGWNRETSTVHEGQFVFVTSHGWCRRSQVVDLEAMGFPTSFLDTAPPVRFEEWFHSTPSTNPPYRTDDDYYVLADLRNGDGSILARWQVGRSTQPRRCTNAWTREARTLLDYGPGLRSIYWEDGGRDRVIGEVGACGTRLDSASITLALPDEPLVGMPAPATEVQWTSASVSGTLLSTGTAQTALSVYWGEADAGTNRSLWQHGLDLGIHTNPSLPTVYPATLSGLTNSRTYYYRYAASNAFGEAWPDESRALMTAEVWLETIVSTAVEGGASGGFRIRRSPTMSQEAIPIRYSVGGTAESGEFTIFNMGFATLHAGSDHVNITVTAVDDLTLHEQPKTVVLTLDSGPYVVGGASEVTITLLDNDVLEPARLPYRAKISFPGYRGTAPIYGFPALVVLGTNVPNFSYATFISGEGDDLRFTSADGSALLAYEIEEWNTNGASHVWVRLIRLSGPNTYIWAYWGHPDFAAKPGYTSDGTTWSHAFDGVWHLDHVGGIEDLTDSSGSGFHATDGAGNTDNVLGRISHGQRFRSADTDTMTLGAGTGEVFLPEAHSPVSFSCWAKPNAIGPNIFQNFLLCIPAGNIAPFPSIGMGFCLTNRAAVYLGNSDYSTARPLVSVTVASTGRWNHVAGFFDGRNAGLYLNGQLAAYEDRSHLLAGAAYPTQFGSFAGSRYYFDGILDEMRISSSIQNSAWYESEWLTGASNAVFTAYGEVEHRRGMLIIVR